MLLFTDGATQTFERLYFGQSLELLLGYKPQKKLKLIWKCQQHFRLVFIINVNLRKSLMQLFCFFVVRMRLDWQTLLYRQNFKQKFNFLHTVLIQVLLERLLFTKLRLTIRMNPHPELCISLERLLRQGAYQTIFIFATPGVTLDLVDGQDNDWLLRKFWQI